MYVDQAILVHQAAVSPYRPGQEDTTLRVLSSVSSDAGTCAVLQEPQADPTGYQVQATGAWAWLRSNAMAVDRRSDSLLARSMRRATVSSSSRRAADSTPPSTTIAPAPISIAMPVAGFTSSMRTANTETSAAAAARINAVVAPSSAHWLRIRRRARPINR